MVVFPCGWWARRAHRELGRLGQERTAHINRIRALLVLQNLRVKYVGGRLWQRWWARHAGELRGPVCVRRSSARVALALSVGVIAVGYRFLLFLITLYGA